MFRILILMITLLFILISGALTQNKSLLLIYSSWCKQSRNTLDSFQSILSKKAFSQVEMISYDLIIDQPNDEINSIWTSKFQSNFNSSQIKGVPLVLMSKYIEGRREIKSYDYDVSSLDIEYNLNIFFKEKLPTVGEVNIEKLIRKYQNVLLFFGNGDKFPGCMQAFSKSSKENSLYYHLLLKENAFKSLQEQFFVIDSRNNLQIQQFDLDAVYIIIMRGADRYDNILKISTDSTCSKEFSRFFNRTSPPFKISHFNHKFISFLKQPVNQKTVAFHLIVPTLPQFKKIVDQFHLNSNLFRRNSKQPFIATAMAEILLHRFLEMNISATPVLVAYSFQPRFFTKVYLYDKESRQYRLHMRQWMEDVLQSGVNQNTPKPLLSFAEQNRQQVDFQVQKRNKVHNFLLLNEIVKSFGRITHSLILVTTKYCLSCIRLYALMEQLEVATLKVEMNMIQITTEQCIRELNFECEKVPSMYYLKKVKEVKINPIEWRGFSKEEILLQLSEIIEK